MESVISAGISLLVTTLPSPSEPQTADGFGCLSLQGQPYPPVSGSITLSVMCYAQALKVNAKHLQIPPEDVLNEVAVSPFALPERHGSADSDGSEASVMTREASDTRLYAHIKPDLRPTAAQRNIPHHPCYDLIPWPVFRTRAIIAASMDPPLIDEDDLYLDIMSDAFRCWGSGAAPLHGRGLGSPWDQRSWEAAPWFLSKLEALTDGPDGDLWKNSAWWRSMRSP